MQELNCSKCGANLKFDPISKKIVCPFCGQVDEDLEEQTVTLGQVDQAINNGEFGKASRLVVAIKKRSPEPDPRLTLRSAYCSFQSKNMSELLTKNPKDATYFEKIMEHESFKKLDEELPEEKKSFVKKVNQYCENSLSIISGVSDQAKKKQIVKLRKEGKMAKLPSLQNSAKELSLMPFWVILGVIVGIILAVEMDRNSSDGMGLFSLFLSVPFCIILSVSLGSLIGYIFPAGSDNRYNREKDWEESAEGGVDQMMTQADIEDLSRENNELLSKIEKLEKDIL
ncbi:MAG: zinc ribbon domain-containing protein [Clostridiales bacterium]|nr:zinc ribbon domain-containing protein [Clostridiales bacterium]